MKRSVEVGLQVTALVDRITAASREQIWQAMGHIFRAGEGEKAVSDRREREHQPGVPRVLADGLGD